MDYISERMNIYTMKRKFLITFVFLLSFLTACGNESQSNIEQVDDRTDLPAWIMNFFDEEELESGEMLTLHTSGGDYPGYNDLDDLIALGPITDIVKAKVLDERVEWLDYTLPLSEDLLEYLGIEDEHEPRYEPYTVHRLQVLEVFQGNAETGDIVEVSQSGGQTERFTLINDSMLTLMIGDIFVFFLNDVNEEGLPIVPMRLVNPYQTVYRLPAFGEGGLSRNSHQELENIYPSWFPFTLELGDLVQLWIQNLDNATELDADIGDMQVYTLDGVAYTLEEISHMPYEQAHSLDLTQDSLQAILDSGAVLAG